ncbi:hypothetical protein [Streptomyces sp. NPDC059215]|uniref:hypothetical protein n=1 Tax=unclassified Streptomyces TaxID=2593676 RepID=UPI0036CCB255
MTLQIDSTKAVIFVAGCVVMYFVFKYTRRSHPGPVTSGDLVGSIAAGATAMAVLAFLMVPQARTEPDEFPAPMSTSTSMPTSGSGSAPASSSTPTPAPPTAK